MTKKEKLYTVELPNLNDSEGRHIILFKTEHGICIDCYFNNNWKKLNEAQLTETEIKKEFDWAWKFAKEVEK